MTLGATWGGVAERSHDNHQGEVEATPHGRGGGGRGNGNRAAEQERGSRADIVMGADVADKRAKM